MPFIRRYLSWVLIWGAVISVPMSLLFLFQVLPLTASARAAIIAAVYGAYAVGVAIIYLRLAPQLRAIDAAATVERDTRNRLGALISQTLVATMRLSILMWLGGGIVFAAAATLVLLPSLVGFGYFIIAALIAGVPAVIMSYFAAKRILFSATRNAASLRYESRLFSVGKKIGLLFVICFLITVAALVAIVSSKVSTTLERVAINGASEEFSRVYELANQSSSLDRAALEALSASLTRGHVLHLLPPTGSVLTAGDAGAGENRELTAAEIDLIRRLKNGDSTAFIAPHVTRFRTLRNGSVLALAVPWGEYRTIPNQIAFYTFLVGVLTALLFVSGSYFLATDITNPLRGLMKVADQMAKGDLEANVRIFSDDEVGLLADRFHKTRDQLSGLISRMGSSGSSITDGVRVITGGTETLLESARRQTTLAESSTDSLRSVRGGAEAVLAAAETVSELTQDVSARSLELQASAEEVARSMDYLFQSVDKSSSSTTQMEASTGEMSRRTDTLANISEEVLTFVAEMDSTIEELRRSATSTADISRQVREDASAGGDAVYATVEGISEAKASTERVSAVLDELQRNVGQITQILRVIEEITDRTNLLALNAAIIAAQAGEHGAGFTVVADEIRQLADRTRGQTKEISGIIKTVQGVSREAAQAMKDGISRVNRNVELAQNAAASLQKIMGSASQSYEMATKIAASLQEQALASRHLHEVTSRMSDNISEINKATQEQARGSKMLSEEADRVREIALQVKNATEQQSVAGHGITQAMEQISGDVMRIRDLLQRQLKESEQISTVSSALVSIAKKNDEIAQNFTHTVRSLAQSGENFEAEVAKFKIRG